MRFSLPVVMVVLFGCSGSDGVGQDAGGGDASVTGQDASVVGQDAAPGSDAGPVLMADLYVSPNGSDSNDGTTSTTSGSHGPLATVDKARQKLQAASFGKGTKPLLVYVEDGSLDGGVKPYFNTALAFTAADSGALNSAVTYAAYPGHAPVLSGGARLVGWTDAGSCGTACEKWTLNLSPATYSYFESLFYNDRRSFRPRVGATADNLTGSYYRIQTGSQTGAQTSFFYSNSDPISPAWTNLGGSYPTGDVVAFDFEDWSVDICRMQSINGAAPGGGRGTITCTGSTPDGTAHGFFVNHRYLVENVKDLLSYPGQWFLDRSASPWVLTYLAASGTENPNTDSVVVPQRDQVLTAEKLSYVSFNGLTFAHDNFTVSATGYQSTQQEPTVPAMVHCNSCSHLGFDSDQFLHTTGVGLDVVGASSDVAITHSIAADTGSHGFRLGQQPSTTDAESSLPTRITLTDSAAVGVGRVIAGSFGIAGGLFNSSEIGWNTVSDSYNSGIAICEPIQGGVCGGGNNQGPHDINIHDNDIWSIGSGVTDDMGGIYIMNAVCTAADVNCTSISGGAANDVVTHNSVAYVTDASVYDADGYGGHGIYLDQNSARVSVSSNRVHGVTGTALNMTRSSNIDGQPNIWNDNIAADGLKALIGSSGCPPVIPDQQFQATHNLFFSRIAQGQGFAIQKAGANYYGTGNPTLMQLFADNQYYDPNWNWQTTGAPFTYQTTWAAGDDLVGACSGTTHIAWSAWTGTIPGTTGGQDDGSSFGSPGFKKPYCTYHTAQQCHDDATMDDYSAASTPGTSPASPGGAPITLSGFGRRIGPKIPTAPSTFPTMPADPSTAFCSGAVCP